jgi:hypothetical protein
MGVFSTMQGFTRVVRRDALARFGCRIVVFAIVAIDAASHEAAIVAEEAKLFSCRARVGVPRNAFLLVDVP